MKQLAALATACLVALVGCSSGSSHASQSAATTTAPAASSTPSAAPTTASCDRPHLPGQWTQVLRFEGRDRTYELYVPPKYTGRQAVPVVFNFHGFGSNAKQQMIYGNFRPEADRDGFLIVAPDGQDPAARHFNLTGEKGLQNDVQMVGALLDHIEGSFCVDSRRVYSTGMSDGGAMTSALACAMPKRFAAYAAVAVVFYSRGCANGSLVAIAAFSGTADPVVPFTGGRVNCCGGPSLPAPTAAMAGWAAHNGCATKRERKIGTDVALTRWTACRGTSAVDFYVIQGGGHTWPGSIPIPSLGRTTQTINATSVIWQFFQAHPQAA
jgi:polyhydroxybutyrate depolymerase